MAKYAHNARTRKQEKARKALVESLAHGPLQDLFNKAYLGVLAQGTRSAVPFEDRALCLYRGPNGTKCGVGHMIPDEAYGPDMDDDGEGNPVGVVLRDVLGARDEVSEIRRRFLGAIQDAHDGDPASRDLGLAGFKEAMAEVALEYGLEIPELHP